jgi:YbgC/YbaW family acyl-CoA thioester hydrolase
MNLLGRLFFIILKSLSYQRGAFHALDGASLCFRVLPHDLDINIHVNNARYLQWMDLGRFDFMNRLGIFRAALRNRWMPVLGGVNIRYHRPLHFLQRVELTTRVAGWDEKWFYMEQTFSREGKPIATAYAKALFRGPERSIPSQEVMQLIGWTAPSPPLDLDAWGVKDQ